MKNDVKAIKLITGEELISRVTEGENNTLILDTPMILQPIPTDRPGQMSLALMPWLMAGKGKEISISADNIILQDEVKDDVEKNYLAQVTGLTL